MKVLVRDTQGTSRWEKPACQCETWIEHWDNNSNVEMPSVCPVCKRPTSKKDLVGGHVKVTAYFDVARQTWIGNDIDNRNYITPICRSCNSRGGFTDIMIDEDYLVSARRVDCCRYRG